MDRFCSRRSWAGIISGRGAESLVERIQIISQSEEETLEIGKKIGIECSGGEVFLLSGPLGAGKSVLARGIARGLGIDGTVRSPSFNLMREYNGNLILKHWDLYRLDDGFRELGMVDSITDDAVVVIEWADRWSELDRIGSGSITMDYGTSETERILDISGDVPGVKS